MNSFLQKYGFTPASFFQLILITVKLFKMAIQNGQLLHKRLEKLFRSNVLRQVCQLTK